MSAGAASRTRMPADVVVAALAALAVGWGVVLLLPGVTTGRVDWLLAGGLAAGAGVFTALVAGWLDDLALLILAVPLPALLSTDAVRVSAPLLASVLVVGAWALRRPGPGRPLRLGSLPVLPGVALLAAMGVSTLGAAEPGAAVRELANVTLLAALLVAATDALAGRPDRVVRLAWVLAGAGGAAGLAGGLEAVGILPGTYALFGSSLFRAGGGFGQPNGLGMFLALCVPFVAFTWTTARPGGPRVAAGVLGMCLGVGLVSTFSRGSWVTVVLAPAALLLVGDWRTVLRFALLAALGAVIVDVASGGAVSGRVLASLEDPSALQRLALMGAGGLMALDHPLLGVGPGGFGVALEEYGLLVPGLWDFVPSAHNAYIHMAAETGLLGLLPYLVLVGTVGWRLLMRAREVRRGAEGVLARCLLWAWATAVVLGLFEWTLVHGAAQVILLVVAMGMAEPADRATAPAP